KLAVPTIAGEPGLLRGHGTGALDGGEVLGEDDAPLQLAGARVRRGGEVDGGAGGPEGGPVLFGGGEGGGGVGGGVLGGPEGAAEGEAISGGSQHEAVRSFPLDAGVDAGPRDADG